MNVFKAVKENVSLRDAAERYGLNVHRNGMCNCPFHNDRSPSMKLYEDGKFHCFSCATNGDVIDLTSRLFNLKSKEAAEKLAGDFGIFYSNEKCVPAKSSVPVSPPWEEQRKVERDELRCYITYCQWLDVLAEWKKEYAPKMSDTDFHPKFSEALAQIPKFEYLIEALQSGSLDDKRDFVSQHLPEVVQLEKRIAKNQQEKFQNILRSPLNTTQNASRSYGDRHQGLEH